MEDDPRYRDPTDLYRYFDCDGDLLYVGIAVDHQSRHDQHFKTAGWFNYATHCTVETFPTRYLAEWAEAHVIASEKPEFNAKFPHPHDCANVWDAWYAAKTGGKPVGENKRRFVLAWPEHGWFRAVPLELCND